MNKQCVRWKTFRTINIRGTVTDCHFTDMLDLFVRGKLIHQILNMERKQGIEFVEAVRFAHQKYEEARKEGHFGYKPGECFWFVDHFVEWISSLGYHIELTGDEFEPYQISSHIN